MRLERLTPGTLLQRSKARDSVEERQAVARLRRKILGAEAVPGETLALGSLDDMSFSSAIRKSISSRALAIVSPHIQPNVDSFIMAEGALGGVEIRFLHRADLPGSQVVSGRALHARGRVEKGAYIHFNAEALALNWRVQSEEAAPWFESLMAQLKHPLTTWQMDKFWAQVIAS